MSVAAAQDWDSVFALDRYCMVELQFWKDNLRFVNSKTVSNLAFPFISIYSDASNVACAGHIAGKDDTLTGCLPKQNARRALLTASC